MAWYVCSYVNEKTDPKPSWNEADRLKAVESYEILDTPREEDFDDIVKMAAQICHVPISLISFVTAGRQWFKATVGTGLQETPLNMSICSHAILQTELFEVPDTTKDARFSSNPLVTGDPNVRFYAGALLKTPEGLPLGTVCVLDYKPRTLTEQESAALNALARQVMTQLELRRALKAESRTQEALREANAQLADKATHLEAMVEHRTLKLLETIGELEAFSYSIAHDMRAPLRSMQGFSQILVSDYAGKLDAGAQDYLNRIAAAAARMDKLIRDVLNYSGVVRGDLMLESVDMDQLLRGIVETYPMFAPDQADLLLEGPFPRILGNEAMLMQVFSNLMGNAVKFVRPGVKSRIRIWAETRGQKVRVSVQDNGIGIPADQFEKIFAIFQQVSKDFEGTGIGLAIVKKAVERMGGELGLQSVLDQGSTFWIEMQHG
jgi:signal transduction histidine kinase